MTDDKGFVGEDARAGRASPVLDLIASAFLIVFAAWVMFESLSFKVPDTLATAPGLLPFLTAASMGAMAAVLALGAWRRYRAGEKGEEASKSEDVGDPARTAGLIAIIIAYLLGLEYLAFEYQFRFLGMWLTLGAFELVSTIVLTVILFFFWRKALWMCFAVALVWILLLAGAFRYVFTIPLPG